MAKPKKKLREEKEQEERVRKLRDDPFLCERALPSEDFPRWMDTIGTRLFTACKLVCKCAHEMVYQFRTPPECVEHAQQLFYLYLSKAGIAFCKEEITDNSEQAFCPLVKRTMQEIAILKAQQKREERASKKQKQKEHLEQSSIWEQLTQSNLEENKEFVKLNKGEPEIGLFERVNTKLSISAINMTSVIYLGIDLLLGIVYMATQMCGCQWIQLSDIFRWYREGRFAISHSQLCALNFATSWTVEHQRSAVAEGSGGEMMARAAERRFFNRSMYLKPYLAIQPISESLRVLTFFIQFIGIPRSISTLEFDKVLIRLVYNLNLPCIFLRHLFIIKQILPLVNVDYGARRFSNIIPIDPELCKRLHWVTVKRERGHIGFNSFMQRAFLSNHAQKRWNRENGDETSDLLIPNRGAWHCAPLSTETKAAAMILLSLKLFFGLDGHREYLVRPKQRQTYCNASSSKENDNYEDIEVDDWERSENHSHRQQTTDEHEQPNEHFNFDEWLTQLQLRTHCWQGTTAGVALRKDFHRNQLERSDPTDATNVRETSKGPSQSTPLFHYSRTVPFAGCVPNTLHNRGQSKLFENLFPTQYKPAPILKDTDQNNPSMSREALFAPLQYQAIINREFQHKHDNQNNLHKKNVKIFFKRFYDTNMDLELPEDAKVADQSTIGDNNIFLEMFPCANSFVRLPAPPLRFFALVVPELDDHGLIVSRDFRKIPVRVISAPIAPILPHKQAKIALCVNEHLLSSSFRLLLRHLSLAISEAEHLLYIAYLMVEMLMYNRTEYDQIERDLRNHGRVIFSSHQNKESGKPVQIRYTITLDNNSNENDDRHDQGQGVNIIDGDNNNNVPTHQFRYKLSRARFRSNRSANGNIPTAVNDADIAQQQIKIHPQIFQTEVQIDNPIEGTPAPPHIAETGTDNESQEAEDSTNSSTSSSDTSVKSDSDDDGSTSKREKRHLRLISLPAPAALTLCTFRHW